PQTTHYDTPASQYSQQPQTHGSMYPQHYPPAPHMDPQSAQAAYGAYPHQQGYPVPGQVDYSAYSYVGYTQDPAASAYAGGAVGWDMSGMAGQIALQLLPFNSSQPGRHKAVPLPTDFMSGPSDAPRLSMPEPHEVLGTIRGVIIRDAHGNIGLSQYVFTQATS
ncbi:hypothetical protein BGW38_007378, partial [Lunasporangiospora selenospora]